MKRLPTDLQILNAIYDKYYDSFSNQASDRVTKIYVPIDVQAIAADLGVDSDIVFGRLHYSLEQKYRYTNARGDAVNFFTLAIGKEPQIDRHCVNFPYLASVLAELRDEERRTRTPNWISVIALFVSLLSIVVSVIR